MPAPACAARCGVVAALVLELARATGRQEQVVRVSHGLPGEDGAHLPAPGTTRATCTACGHVYRGAGAVTAARECRDLDDGSTD